jgi:hypothetical protein
VLVFRKQTNKNEPINIHLLTFDQLNTKEYLIHIEHYFQFNEDEIYSEPVTIDLQTLFKSIGKIGEIIELTLNVDLSLSELHRLNRIIKDQ